MAGNIKRIIIDVKETQGRAQTAASPKERAIRENSGRTQGRKGCKQPRMNLALWAENYTYVKTLSKAHGWHYSRYINELIKERREQDNRYQRLKEILGEE